MLKGHTSGAEDKRSALLNPGCAAAVALPLEPLAHRTSASDSDRIWNVPGCAAILGSPVGLDKAKTHLL